ncbi:MAG TPA: hypothetical protein VFU63_14400 [Ktedonobacterales bacterium]|nr:hypothetical protein [Ktedonobacterales bacterium]
MRASSRRYLILWSRLSLVAILALAGLLAVGVVHPPHVQAAGGDPIIHWDSGMIYPGQNNGYPWGPVGEIALVHGEKFTGSAVLGLPVKLALLKGDVNNPPGGDSSYEFCKLSGPKIELPGQAQVDSSGNFDYNFIWPVAAGPGMYSICAYNTVDGLPAGNIDDGPFTVLTGSAPKIVVSRTAVAAGESVTVTGQNWVPPQPVNVYIGACADCDGVVVAAGTAHSSGLNTGTFSITFTIPGNTTPGNYVVGAIAHGAVLDVGPGGAVPLTINAAPPPTAVPTATGEATVLPTLASGSGGAGNNNSDSTGSQGISPLVLALIGVGVLLLVVLLVVLVVVLSRRGARKIHPDVLGGPAQGWSGPDPSVGYGGGAVPPDGETVRQNWQALAPGQSNQTSPTVSDGMPQGDDAPTQPRIYGDTLPPNPSDSRGS